MQTEEITLKVSSDSLVDEIVRLIGDDELTNEHKKRIEQSLNIPEPDPDISDFDDESIDQEFWGGNCIKIGIRIYCNKYATTLTFLTMAKGQRLETSSIRRYCGS